MPLHEIHTYVCRLAGHPELALLHQRAHEREGVRAVRALQVARHLGEDRPRQAVVTIGIEHGGERVHLLTPGPERAVTSLTAVSHGAVEGMAVGVRKSGDGQAVQSLGIGRCRSGCRWSRLAPPKMSENIDKYRIKCQINRLNRLASLNVAWYRWRCRSVSPNLRQVSVDLSVQKTSASIGSFASSPGAPIASGAKLQ